MLIIVQCIERYETLSENFIRTVGWRGADKIQDLRSNLLMKDCNHLVKLGLTDLNVSDCELCVHLSKPNLCSI